MQKHPTNPAKKSRQGADSGAITISKLRENDPIQEGPVDDNQANKTAEEIVQNLALNDDDRHHAEGLSDNMHPFKSNCKCYITATIFIILDLCLLRKFENFCFLSTNWWILLILTVRATICVCLGENSFLFF